MLDTVILNGTIVDGTGKPCRLERTSGYGRGQ